MTDFLDLSPTDFSGGGDGLSVAQVQAIAEESSGLVTRRVSASTNITAGERVVVVAGGVVLAFPNTGQENDQILVNNSSGSTVSMTGPLDGDPAGTLEGPGTIVFVWDTVASEWNGYIFSAASTLTATQISAA